MRKNKKTQNEKEYISSSLEASFSAVESFYGRLLCICLISSVITGFFYYGLNVKICEAFFNLGLGATASVVIAFCINYKDCVIKNAEANLLYDAHYGKIKITIETLIVQWANICNVTNEYTCDIERRTWLEWIELAKKQYINSTMESKKLLINLYKEYQVFSKKILEELNLIKVNKVLLEIKGVHTLELDKIIEGFAGCFDRYSKIEFDMEKDFFEDILLISKDLNEIMSTWDETKHLINKKFLPE